VNVFKTLKKLFMPEIYVVKGLRGETVIVEKKCRVCSHPERERIEKMLLEGKTYFQFSL